MNKTILHIIEIGCSGIVGVFITIGYQHFFTQPQNQQIEQIQTQEQEQTQNQSVIVNINGQEISYESEDVIALNNTISELEEKNLQFKSDYEMLEETNNNLISELKKCKKELEKSDIVEFKKVQFMENGLELELANSAIIFYKSTPYFSLDTLNDIYPDNILFDDKNLIITLGKVVPQKEYLLNLDSSPYQTDDHYIEPDYMTMCGEEYKNGFQMNWDKGYSLFNLKGKYSKIEFDLGHIDGGAMVNGVFEIYLDEEFYKKIDMISNSLVQHYEFEINGAKQMQFVWGSGSNSIINFGIANITVE